MRAATAKVTSKRQVTLPKELTELFGIEPGDRLIFTERDGVIQVEKASDWVQRTAGILRRPMPEPPPSAEEERRRFEEAVAREVTQGSDAS
jgi:AbrB family looped-hinge helix DNA binding protein